MRQVVSSVRYTGVLAVWTGLLLVRPPRPGDLREERAGSPLPRFRLQRSGGPATQARAVPARCDSGGDSRRAASQIHRACW